MCKCLTFFCLFISGTVFSSAIPKNISQPNLFTENKGQMIDMDGNAVPFVLFKQEAKGCNFFITEKGLTYLFSKAEEEKQEKRNPKKQREEEKDEEVVNWERIDVELKGSSIKKENVVAEGQSEFYSQYFLANCSDGIKNVHSYEKVTIKNIYPNIDWVFYNSSERGVKYDFIVHQGANPNNIQLIYSSRKKINLTNEGALEIKTTYGDLEETAPKSFADGKSIP